MKMKKAVFLIMITPLTGYMVNGMGDPVFRDSRIGMERNS